MGAMINLLQTEKRRSGFRMLKSCKPFIENKRAVLIHRPIAINLHKLMGKYHMSIQYACGNSHCGSDKFTFLDSLNDDHVLCQRCEQKAVEMGYETANTICGKHVHIGGVKAVINCCPNLN